MNIPAATVFCKIPASFSIAIFDYILNFEPILMGFATRQKNSEECNHGSIATVKSLDIINSLALNSNTTTVRDWPFSYRLYKAYNVVFAINSLIRF